MTKGRIDFHFLKTLPPPDSLCVCPLPARGFLRDLHEGDFSRPMQHFFREKWSFHQNLLPFQFSLTPNAQYHYLPRACYLKFNGMFIHLKRRLKSASSQFLLSVHSLVMLTSASRARPRLTQEPGIQCRFPM